MQPETDAGKAGPDWMLVDGSSLIFRAFYGVPATTRAPDGRQINAVRGFVETITRLLYSRRPRRIAVASDEDWRPQRRVDLIPTYKAHRVGEPVPPALIPQMPLIDSLLQAIGIDLVGAPELEAEDVIASWVDQLSGRIHIVSGDRDLFALVRDPDVVVLYPERTGLAEIDEAEITRRYGIPGRLYSDFAVLRGDPSDGLPGLAGVGAKTAAALITKHGGLDGLIAAGGLSPGACEYIRVAREVVRPGSPQPVAPPRGWQDQWPASPADLESIVEDLGIRKPVDQLIESLRGTVMA
jgi:5'-3' exonuclease